MGQQHQHIQCNQARNSHKCGETKTTQPEDEEVEQNRRMESIACINEAISRSKLTQKQNEKEIRERQEALDNRQQQRNATPDSTKGTSDSKDSKQSKKGRNVRPKN
jgi:hypothetical protein